MRNTGTAKKHISIIGTRGIPANYGGFETFAEEISVRLVEKGVRVTVYGEKDQHPGQTDFKGVALHKLAITKSGHQLQYYRESLDLAMKDSDLILVCGSPGALFFYKKWLSKSKAVIALNTDGVEYKRSKWGLAARMLLHISEFIGAKLADILIADSVGIEAHLIKSYGKGIARKTKVIEYGAYINGIEDDGYLASLGLKPDGYYLVVARLEPENNVHTILEGFSRSATGMKLIVVGNLMDTPYVQSLKAFETDPRIRFVGGIYDRTQLAILRKYAFAYFHGHSVGGTNPSLLEGLGSGNIVIAHNNLYNRGVMQNQMFYFDTPMDCITAIQATESLPADQRAALKTFSTGRIRDHYNWENMTDLYYKLLQDVTTKL